MKVGRSVNSTSRLASLQTGNPRSLKLILQHRMLRDDAIKAEIALLEELNEFALVGEWLDLNEEFMRGYMQNFLLAEGLELA